MKHVCIPSFMSVDTAVIESFLQQKEEEKNDNDIMWKKCITQTKSDHFKLFFGVQPGFDVSYTVEPLKVNEIERNS